MSSIVFTNGLKIEAPELKENEIGYQSVELARSWVDLGAPLAEAVAMAALVYPYALGRGQ